MNWLLQTLAFTEREYLPTVFNVLTNGLKISHASKKEFFVLIFIQSEQKI